MFVPVVDYGLSAADEIAEIGEHLEVVAAGGEGVADVGGDAVLDEEVATAPGGFGEARGFERELDVHAVVDDVGDELRVGLCLVETAHDAEADVDAVLLHEGRDDGVEGAFAGRV